MKMEAEPGLMLPQAEEGMGRSEVGRGTEGTLELEHSEGVLPT
jgi:hypothetical protein